MENERLFYREMVLRGSVSEFSNFKHLMPSQKFINNKERKKNPDV